MVRVPTAKDKREHGSSNILAILDMRGEWEMPIFSPDCPLLSDEDKAQIKSWDVK